MKSRHGFTLLELLVALSITAAIISAVVFAFTSWVRTQERADLALERQRSLEFALDRLRDTIGSCYVPFAPGWEATAVFEDMELERPTEPFDALTFVSLAHRTQRIDAKESEMIEMTVYTVPDPELENGDQCRILKLREGGTINDRFEVEGGSSYELLRNVGRLQIFYLDTGGELKQEWKVSESGGALPCAVAIWLGAGCGDQEEDWCLFLPLYLTNTLGCVFEPEALKDVCQITK